MPVQRSTSGTNIATFFLLFCYADAYPSTPSAASHVVRSPASARTSPRPYLHLQFSQIPLPPQALTPRANGEAPIASQRLVSPPPAPPPPKQCPPSLWLLQQVAPLHITTPVPVLSFIIRRSSLALSAAARLTLSLPLPILCFKHLFFSSAFLSCRLQERRPSVSVTAGLPCARPRPDGPGGDGPVPPPLHSPNPFLVYFTPFDLQVPQRAAAAGSRGVPRAAAA
jgi:hypothetical protein